MKKNWKKGLVLLLAFCVAWSAGGLGNVYAKSLEEIRQEQLENKKKKDDSTIVLFNSYLFKLNFCKAPFEQDEQLYRRKREKQYGSSC